MASNEFTIDKVEYQSVFKVFDRENKGSIQIEQVNQFIQMFEEVQISPAEEDKRGAAAQPQNTSSQYAQNKQSRQLQGSGAMGNSNGAAPGQGLTGVGGKMTRPGGLNAKQIQQQQTSAGAQGTTVTQQSPTKRNSNATTQNNANSGTAPGTTQQQAFGVGSHAQFNNGGNGGGARNQGASRRANNGSSSQNNATDTNFINGISGAPAVQATNAMMDEQNSNAAAASNVIQPKKCDDVTGAVTSSNTMPATAGSSQQSAQQQMAMASGPGQVPCFPNGNQSLQFEEFIEVIKDSCTDPESAENYLVFAFSMFDREKKGYISAQDLKCVFSLLGETVSDEEIQSKYLQSVKDTDQLMAGAASYFNQNLEAMIKIAGTKSNDKINFKEFVDFFYKVD